MADRFHVRTLVDPGDNNGGSSHVVWEAVTPRRRGRLPVVLLSCVISLLLMLALAW